MNPDDIAAILFFAQKIIPVMIISLVALIALTVLVWSVIVHWGKSAAQRAGYRSIMEQLPGVLNESKEFVNTPVPPNYNVKLGIQFKVGQLRALDMLQAYHNLQKTKKRTGRPGKGSR